MKTIAIYTALKIAGASLTGINGYVGVTGSWTQEDASNRTAIVCEVEDAAEVTDGLLPCNNVFDASDSVWVDAAEVGNAEGNAYLVRFIDDDVVGTEEVTPQ